jgi:hypothetical protein
MVFAGSIGDGFLGRDRNARSHKYISSHKKEERITIRDEDLRK